MGKIAAVVSFEEHWSGQGELLPGKGFVVRRLSPFATCKGDLCGSTESMGVFTRPLIMTPCCRGQLLFKIQVDLNCLFGLAVYAHYLDPNYFFTLLGLPFCEKHSFQPPLRAATAHQVEWNTVSPTMCQNVLLTRPLALCTRCLSLSPVCLLFVEDPDAWRKESIIMQDAPSWVIRACGTSCAQQRAHVRLFLLALQAYLYLSVCKCAHTTRTCVNGVLPCIRACAYAGVCTN